MTIFALLSGLLIVLVATSLCVLAVWSRPGTPAPFLDADGQRLPGSISEKVWLNINGARQGMFLKGRDAASPVLLYLHGGLPDYVLASRYPPLFDTAFVVCWWEQRGSGLSYRSGMSPASVTLDQLVADAIALTRELQQRFKQDRIYLMGHSGGSYLGMHVIARAPELYHAYVGVAQMANQRSSEVRAYNYMLGRCRAEGRQRLAKQLAAAPVTMANGVTPEYLRLRDTAMHTLGVGTMRHMQSVVTGLFLESLRHREYSLTEKINLWRGKAAMGVSSMWTGMLEADLSERIPRVEVPVYFLHGLHDYTCAFEEAASYFSHLDAPRKGFYTFEHSAHSPMFEEPERVMRVFREDVLCGTTRLADEAPRARPAAL